MISILLSIWMVQPLLPGEDAELCRANPDLSAVWDTMGKVSFVALTALGRREGRVWAGGEGVQLKRRRTMCEKLRLSVSHTDQYVPPTPHPLWERQVCSDQPTADPALIGFFFFFFIVLSRDENPFVA